MSKENILEMFQTGGGLFLLGWIFGAGLFPMLVEQLSQAF